MTRRTNASPPAGTGAERTNAPQATQLTVKQQRAAKRAQKLAAFRREQARSKRNRLIGIVAATTATCVVLVALVAYVVTSGGGKTEPVKTIAGVHTFRGLTANHVSGQVDYKQTPPVGGNHAAVPLNCGVYSQPVPNENAVHSLEHGAVWVTYDPGVITADKLQTLRKDIPNTYAILSPYDHLPSPIVASAWGKQLKVSNVGDPRIKQFIAKYRQSPHAPEPGAPCSGGIDGTGKISQ